MGSMIQMIRRVRSRVAAVVTVMSLATVSLGGTLDTRFAYQGQLKFGGVPVNDSCDMRFTLFEDFSGFEIAAGTNVFDTTPGTPNPVQVSDGLFQVRLDFGQDVLTRGNPLSLEIDVRCPSGSAEAYTKLSPRQAISPSPRALHAQTAEEIPGLERHSLDAVDGDPVDRLYVAAGGGVGIGTTEPEATLDIRGSIIAQGFPGSNDSSNIAMKKTGPRGPDNVYFALSHRSSGDEVWMFGYDGLEFFNFQSWDFAERTVEFPPGGNNLHLDLTTGRIGMGTSTPYAKLHVNGDIRTDGNVIVPPTTRHLMISAADMVPRVSSMEVYRVFGDVVSFFTPPGQETLLYAPIHLPDGAEITELRAFLSDNAPNHDVAVWIETYGRNAGSLTLAIISTQGTPGLIEVVDDTINSPVIDNSEFAYYLGVSFTVPPDDGETHLRVRPVRIAYEVTSLLP